MTGNPLRADTCITCSDQLLELLVEAVSDDGATARASLDGTVCEIAVDLIDGVVRPGDRVLVHGGVALQRTADGGEV